MSNARIPRLSGKKLLRIFHEHGWELIRVRGSHHILKSVDGRIAVVPVHAGKSVHVGIVANLLRKHLHLSDEEIAGL